MALASEQGSDMAVELLNPELNAGGFFGPCLQVTDDGLHIGAPDRQQISLYANEAVEVRFSVKVGALVEFFRFISVIRGYHQDSGFLLDLPEALRSDQRRALVRIRPPQRNIRLLEIWPLAFDVFPPPPPLVPGYRGGGQGEKLLSLMDISASGLGLRIRTSPDVPVGCFAPSSRILVFLRLKRPAGVIWHDKESARLDIWLTGTIKHRTEGPEFPGSILGVHCTAWALVNGKEQKLSWAVPRAGWEIPPLQKWIWQQQVELSCLQ